MVMLYCDIAEECIVVARAHECAVNITCYIESVSPFTVFWKKNSDYIGGPLFYRVTDVAVWSIPRTALLDSGYYYCIVANDHGNYSAKTLLDVKGLPPLFAGRANFSAFNGRAAFLHCEIWSSSDVNVNWLRHGTTVLNNADTVVHPNGTLHIFQTSPNDAGLYVCQARNSGGITHQSIMLRIVNIPKVSVSPRIIYFLPHSNFNISCHIDGDLALWPQWFYNGSRIDANYKYHVSFRSM
nr:Immunoglobulin domain containing protein [Haemonchus contortus]